MRTVWIIAGVCCVALLARGEEPGKPAAPLESAQAKQALAKRDKDVAAAEAAYREAVAKANAACVKELKAAQAVAMRQGRLDDAVRIKAEVDRLTPPPGMAAAPRQYKFPVVATTMWNDTVKVLKGQRVRVQAAGKWSHDGLTHLKDVKNDPPRARVGDGAVFLLKSDDDTFTADDDGMLRLGLDDGDAQRNYPDNAGTLTVVITVSPPEIPAGPEPEKPKADGPPASPK